MKILKPLTLFLTAIILTASTAMPISAQQLYYEGEQPDISVSASAAILIEADTGTVLFSKNEKQHRSIASTTKIMTTLLTLEAGDLDGQFTVDSTAILAEGTSMGLKEGDIVTRRALCYGMLLPSGNDAANAAAINISGSYSAFAEKMNRKAIALGMENSNFVTPSGLDADGQYSCAYDLALLTAYALKNEDFREICCKKSAKVKFGNPPYERWLNNSNKLLKNYPDCIGVKTGFTDNAGRTLVSAASRNGITLIAVTLNAPDDWDDHTRMLDYGFSKVKKHSVSYDTENLTLVVTGSEKESVRLVAKQANLPLTKSQLNKVTTVVHLPKFIYADVKKGEAVGRIEYILNDRIIAVSEIYTAEECVKKPQEVDFFTRMIRFIRELLS
jgi:D-alanyl-D-alanine carboxypeptidase/D-alanyl-D-alanine carboxypeptidase (penicillin-binding protein 5/6)